MLTNTKVLTVLPVSDLDRACEFYEKTLGLRGSHTDAGPYSRVVDTGKSEIELMKTDHAAPSEHTALTFEVDDVERELSELEGRGVRFEDYDLPGLKTENHIAKMDGHRAAWFKDPDGNVLCIHGKK